ncbi:MAG: M28 family peptidase [Bacteroides sp.]|nr:M28 family peptidase [Bacteroides sp.]MCM1412921.1 M28 family peptidase [Bacteroides sp.]MCM1471590.1 M28 family peptidase [Bacteroides sp.]
MKSFNIALIALLTAACSGSRTDTAAQPEAGVADTAATVEKLPGFNADSAYSYVAAQVAFGPRVPGTRAHTLCRDYLVESFDRLGADSVWIQQADVKAFDGTPLTVNNILASYNLSAPKRILIAAHYDTRPWADEDPDEKQHSQPIDGANDGASGVGVILELARAISQQSPAIGVDFLLTDIEDYGSHDSEDAAGESSWALGAQYFASNSPYTPRRRPAYGILLDMVGGKDAKFYREYFSENAARRINTKVWNAAAAAGISRFVDEVRGGVTDDHIFINRAGIPCIDIIECANPSTGAFPPHWHTKADNLDVIDKATLADVGTVLMRVIYIEPAQ